MASMRKPAIPIIGLKGGLHSGKTTAANYIVERYGYSLRTRFAGPLKGMLETFLVESGVRGSEIIRMIDGDLKQVPSEYLGGKTPREAMQWLGTEWGRNLMSPTLWIDAWTRNVDQLLEKGMTVVVDDCRFENERDVIWERGGLVFEMKNMALRPSGGCFSAHASEKLDFPVDDLIVHNGCQLETLYASADVCMIRGVQTRSDRTWAQAAAEDAA